jgi:cyclic pyranopterin phosphate synthase
MTDNKLTHFDENGKAVMVDVSTKAVTRRKAVAQATLLMAASTLEMILTGTAVKGDVFGVARIAGIMAAKKTDDLIPLCHSIPLEKVTIDFTIDAARSAVTITATTVTTGKTGVEMDALTAATMAALTVYDMVKAVDKNITITDIAIMEKTGGKSGHYIRPGREIL